MNSGGLLSSLASIYENHLFSDVEFIFVAGNEVCRRIQCHSLILALRSKVFASMFFGDSKKKHYHQVELPLSKESSFSHLVRFLYTDDLQSLTFEEAVRLYDLAKEYAVEELQQKCSKYIVNEKLDMDNIFSKYEYALSKGMHLLLKECQNFVCSNSELVLQSDGFTNTSKDVVEDIVKLENLSVSTELEVIGAVLKWGSKELKRQKLPFDEKYLRKCIDPLKKHVRFLTLLREEFNYLIDNYDIFSSKESSKLTQKIIDPLSNVILPDSLSSIDVKRKDKVSSIREPSCPLHRNSSHLYGNETIAPNVPSSNVHPPQAPTPNVPPRNAATSFVLGQNGFMSESLFENVNSDKIFRGFSAKNAQSPSNDSSYDKLLKRSTSDNFLKSSSASALSSQVSPKSLTSIANLEGSTVAELLTSDSNKVLYEIKKISPFDETSKRRNLVDVDKSSQRIRESLHVAQARMYDSSRLRDFEFNLQESLPSLETSFHNDVKSTISFQMITGNMVLHGFEIKVESRSNKAVEELEVDVDLKGFSNQPFSELYKEKLINNCIFIKFRENMVLRAGNKGVLDVSIDNLLLERCGTFCNSSRPLQLNCSNSFSCEMILNSTQKTESRCLFLISKLIYVPC